MENTLRMHGASTNQQFPFLFRPVFLVKGSLHARLAFIFVFSIDQISMFVSLLSITKLFKGETSRFAVERMLLTPTMWHPLCFLL